MRKLYSILNMIMTSFIAVSNLFLILTILILFYFSRALRFWKTFMISNLFPYILALNKSVTLNFIKSNFKPVSASKNWLVLISFFITIISFYPSIQLNNLVLYIAYLINSAYFFGTYFCWISALAKILIKLWLKS